jgi:predicted negative regulator of RcsB-dependent stress response
MSLRNSAAAILVFFSAATGTRFVATGFWRRIPNHEDQSIVLKSMNYLVAEHRKSGKGNRHNMKTTTLQPLILCLAVAGLGQIAFAQNDLNLPDVSQAAEVKQRIALTDIAVKYHRPLVNGRKIWGGLVPYGKVWRAGANENTTIEFSDPVSVEGKPLDKGTYGLHMIPNPDSWTVIFSKTNTGWGSYSYDQKEDALRVDVKPRPLAENKEALEFDFEDLRPTSTAVTLKWEKLGVPFTVSVNDADQTLHNIQAQLKGRGQFTWQALDEGAQFCLTRKIDLDEALRWADASIQNEERFENLSTKADILKALNRSDEAKTAWNQALEKATGPQLYTYGRQLQNQKKSAEAIEIFKEVAKRFPKGVYGNLAEARIKSAAGDFAGATSDAKQAQAAATSDAQKQSIQALITRLDAKQDINK